MSVKSKMTAIADAIRKKTGKTGTLTLDQMAEEIGSIPEPVDYLYLKVTNQPCDEYRNEAMTTTANNAFQGWTNLKAIYLPNLVTIGNYAFQGCSGVKEFVFPKAVTVGNSAFAYASGPTKIDLGSVTSIGSSAFDYTSKLTTLIIRTNSLCTLANSNAFNNTPIKSGTGYIYFYRSWVDSYKSATNWATYSSQIRAIEDFPEITGG
jgi:hypothetical protein